MIKKLPATTAKLQNQIVRNIINSRIYDFVHETALQRAAFLSGDNNAPIYLKREDTHPVFSFKIRGAYHKLAQMPTAQLTNGIIAASAGNHAQGVALAAQRLGVSAVIVMPAHTQQIKVNSVKKFRATVILHGDSFDDSYTHAKKLADERGMVFIPPFDDVDIISGNGTIAAEILRQHPKPIEAIFCAIGGGGLISGVAAYVKAFRPNIRVVGVEAAESASMSAALRAKKRVTLPHTGIFADAVAVKKVGKLTYQLTRDLVDEVVVVSNDAICAAIKELYNETRTVVEPSGAMAVAAIKQYRGNSNNALIGVVCGANMNFDRIGYVTERAEIGENREILLGVTIPEQPGSFYQFCQVLGKRNITEFNYRLHDAKEAHIFVGIETKAQSERGDIINKLTQKKFPVIDLTEDEMSKLHIRHMVGGRADAKDELLYRFDFPERPGALREFLEGLTHAGKRSWNISLFHYRNHGADRGRVLCGIQVPKAEIPLCEDFLQKLGYGFRREDQNRAYTLFLSHQQ